VHALVWCAPGYGWEMQDDALTVDLLCDEVANLKREGDGEKVPPYAILCFKHGARRAAARLAKAGIRTVLSVRTDVTDENGKVAFLDALWGMLDAMHDASSLDQITDEAKATFKGGETECHGDVSAKGSNVWDGSDTPDDRWLVPSLEFKRAEAAKDVLGDFGDLDASLRECDIGHVERLRTRFAEKKKKNKHIVVRTSWKPEGKDKDADRRGREHALECSRAVALETCRAFVGSIEPFESVLRVATDEDLSRVSALLTGKSLVWFDASCTDTNGLNQMTMATRFLNGAASKCSIIVTGLATKAETNDLLRDVKLEFDKDEVLDAGSGPGRDVVAGDLHKEFLLHVTRAGSDEPCLVLEDDIHEEEEDEDNNTVNEVVGERPVTLDRRGHSFRGVSSGRCETFIRCLREALPGDKPVVALYVGDEPGDHLVKVNVSSVGDLHVMRDEILQDEFERKMNACLTRERLSLYVRADASQFAEEYESCILELDKLTPHQDSRLKKMRESAEDGTVTGWHVKAPAGAGKTFVALHFMLEAMQNDASARVLFVAANPALSVFVARWVAERVPAGRNQDDERRALLGRLRVMSTTREPRAVDLDDDNAIVEAPVDVSAGDERYSLIVLDEAHHACLDEKLLASVLDHRRQGREDGATARLVLLSDVSQATVKMEEKFPDGLREILLEEVVRSSKRIVAGASAFQLGGGKIMLTRCHHESEGPPLKSYVFPKVKSGEEDAAACYARFTVKGLNNLMAQFSTLSLHNRLALLVPDDAFLDRYRPHLARALAEAFGDRRFRLVNAREGAAILSDGESVGPSSDEQWLVLDTVSNFDGLERLIIFCVGLDAAEAEAARETRSLLYRALTRAHMMVVVVNEYLQGGMLEFMGHLKFKEEKAPEITNRSATTDSSTTSRRFDADAAKAQMRVEAAAEYVQRADAVREKGGGGEKEQGEVGDASDVREDGDEAAIESDGGNRLANNPSATRRRDVFQSVWEPELEADLATANTADVRFMPFDLSAEAKPYEPSLEDLIHFFAEPAGLESHEGPNPRSERLGEKDITDIYGIGEFSAAKFNKVGIFKAWQLLGIVLNSERATLQILIEHGVSRRYAKKVAFYLLMNYKEFNDDDDRLRASPLPGSLRDSQHVFDITAAPNFSQRAFTLNELRESFESDTSKKYVYEQREFICSRLGEKDITDIYGIGDYSVAEFNKVGIFKAWQLLGIVLVLDKEETVDFLTTVGGVASAYAKRVAYLLLSNYHCHNAD
jgi:predicted flap endonuclease-1-like 5' DNA nuclease